MQNKTKRGAALQRTFINMENTRGGKRKNAGRKKAYYITKTIAFRVRVELAEPIKNIVKDYVIQHLKKIA